MQKLCLTCGNKLTGRSDKKYCNEACKNEFHNQQGVRTPAFEKNQLSAARKNRSILSKIEASGMAEINLKELELCGFDFEGLTGLKFLDKGSFLLYCFDFSLQLKGNSCKIGKDKEQGNQFSSSTH